MAKYIPCNLFSFVIYPHSCSSNGLGRKAELLIEWVAAIGPSLHKSIAPDWLAEQQLVEQRAVIGLPLPSNSVVFFLNPRETLAIYSEPNALLILLTLQHTDYSYITTLKISVALSKLTQTVLSGVFISFINAIFEICCVYAKRELRKLLINFGPNLLLSSVHLRCVLDVAVMFITILKVILVIYT